MRRNSGMMGLSMLGLAACAAMTVGRIRPHIEPEEPQRSKDAAGNGPKLSRQQRRKLERDQAKKGYRR